MHGTTKRKQKFVTLLNVKLGFNPGKEKWQESRAIAMIAEAIFAIMLGAYRPVANHTLRDVCVYGNPLQVFTWSGACHSFCLREPLRRIVAFDPLPSEPRSKEDQMKEWAGQERWFSAYGTKDDPPPENDLMIQGDASDKDIIASSLSQKAEEEITDQDMADEEMADAEPVDQSEDDDDNSSAEEEEPSPEEITNPSKKRGRDGSGPVKEKDLGPTELGKSATKRQKNAENMRRWRAAHPGHKKAKIAAMTPDEKEEYNAKKAEEMRKSRAANPGRDKARVAAMGSDKKAAYNAKTAEDMRRLRAKWGEKNPKPKHVVPDQNKRRNAKRQAKRKLKAGDESKRTAMFQQRVQRARYKLMKLKEKNALGDEIHAALVKLIRPLGGNPEAA